MWHELVEILFVLHLSISISDSVFCLYNTEPPYSQMPMDWEFILGLIAAGTEYIRKDRARLL